MNTNLFLLKSELDLGYFGVIWVISRYTKIRLAFVSLHVTDIKYINIR